MTINGYKNKQTLGRASIAAPISRPQSVSAQPSTAEPRKMKPFKLPARAALLLVACALLLVAPSSADNSTPSVNKELNKLDKLFNKVNADMNTLKKDMSNRPDRAAAAAAATAPETCPLTKANLMNLRKNLNSRLKAASGSQCNIDTETTSYCSEMVTLVQCAINAVQVGYIDAVRSSSSMKKVETLQRTFNGITEVYTREITVVKKSMTVKKHWFDAEKLHKDLQRLQKQLDETTKKLQKATNDLISSYINRGKIDKAIINYNALESANGTAVPGIIESAYRDVKAKKGSNPLVMKNFHRILLFIVKLPGTGDLQLKGYRKLESEMKRAKFEKSVQVVQFYSSLTSVNKVADTTAQLGIDAILKGLQPEVDNLVKKWARGIAKSSRRAMSDLRMLSKYRFNALRPIVAPLVTQAYGGKPRRLPKVLFFLKKVPSLRTRIEGLDALTRQMASKRQLDSTGVFLLAYQLKKVYTHNRFAKIVQASKTQLDAVKALIPQNVQEIVLKGKSCQITSRKYKTSLYADHNRDRKHRFDYLWSPAQRKREDTWRFETTDGGKTWYVKNEAYRGYLMAESSAYNIAEGRRRTFVWRKRNSKTSGSKWLLESADGGKSVVFKNVYRNREYMYADARYKKDSHRRNLFTWQRGKPRGKMWAGAQFEVKCGRQ